tara:strand:+ start:1576 stop:1980 length:405 start_codon:yes stop_codon:yes gene_type:complete
MIDFQFFKTKTISLNKRKKWLKRIILDEGKKLGDITFIFCKDNYLLEKNIQFLKHDALTDVITFDYSENSQISGDIFISIERVKENGEIFGETFLNELNRVMAHGLLHLLGYKDKTKKAAAIMKEKEDFYLSIL